MKNNITETPADLFEAGLKFADDLGEAMQELLMALMLLLQFVLEEAENRKLEDRKKEIYKRLEAIQLAQQAGLPADKILRMLTVNFYEVADLLKHRRAEKNQPALSFKEKLTAYRKLSNEEIEATLHRKLKR